MRFALSVQRDDFRAGDVVRGTVSTSQGGSCREISVRLAYREKAPARSELARELEPTVLGGGDIEAGTTWEFALTLPDDALPSYRTKNGALDWVVIASVDQAGPGSVSVPIPVIAESPFQEKS